SQAVFNQIATTLNTKYFNKLQDQKELARGFANANAASAQNGTMLGYQNYDLFAVMVGTQLSAAVPGYTSNKAASSLKSTTTKGDAYVGVAQSPFVVNTGLNSSFLIKGLYLSAKFGGFNYSTTVSNVDLKYSQKMFGLGANYDMFDGFNLIAGLLRWRGLSFGTGIIYTQNDAKISFINIPDQQINISGTTNVARVYDIKVKYNSKSNALVIPFDLSTSIQALWVLNLGVGAGVDIITPNSKIKVSSDAKTQITGFSGSGNINVIASNTKNKPKFKDRVAPRLSAAVGLNIAPVKIDLNALLYPQTKTAAVGLSAGVVW
ncbi:MAG TPA: hypothetical protein VF857_03235, partial [Spirochaetota bacterium]